MGATVGDAVGLVDGTALGLVEGLLDGDVLGTADGEALGSAVGLVDGCALGLQVGLALGATVLSQQPINIPAWEGNGHSLLPATDKSSGLLSYVFTVPSFHCPRFSE